MNSKVSEENLIPVEEDKHKEDKNAEMVTTMEALKCECLKSFDASRMGEVVKKFDFFNSLAVDRDFEVK